MLHKILEAKATTTDLGEFTAIAAAYTVDRTNERIVPGAFKNTITAWAKSGKQIPLHWNHSDDPRDIIGVIDPASMKEVDEGLQVAGKLDLEDSEVAREAWRLMRKNAVALSFGYLVLDDAKAEDDVRELKEIDLFEITITPAPANPDTRFIDMKSVNPLLDPDAIQLSPEAIIRGDELKGAQEGLVKAVWTAAYINDLPDSCFLYIESGGEKDEDGKTTPRSLRHFPVKDAQGNVDLPHLRNALARIPQSSLPQSVKDRVTAMAQRMLDDAKNVRIEDVNDKEPHEAKSQAQDSLTKGHDRVQFELTTAGIDMTPAPQPPAEEPPDEPSLEELERQYFDLTLELLK